MIIRVKPLAWVKDTEHADLVAETPIGDYSISIGEGSTLHKPFELSDPWGQIKYFASIENAKQVALVWYNETIVECLQ